MKNKQTRLPKEPSLLRKIIDIQYEQAQRRKALRILNKQKWSVEFMEYLICHAAKQLDKDIIITVTSPAGHKLEIKSSAGHNSKLDTDNDIFDKLNDLSAVDDFIARNSVR